MTRLLPDDLQWWSAQLEQVAARVELPTSPDAANDVDVDVERVILGAAELGLLVAGVLARCSGAAQVVVTVADAGSWTPVCLDLSDDPSRAVAIRRWHRAVAEAAEHAVDPITLAAAVGSAITQVTVRTTEAPPWPWPAAPAVSLVSDDAGGTTVETRGQAVAGRLAQYLLTLARGWADDLPLSQAPMLAADELAELHAKASGPTLELPHATVWDLVRATRERTPDATAVVDDDVVLSYAELVDRAHGLAVGLRRRGLGAGDLVGVSVRRSADMVVGLLGIMASGAAYVPIDPDYPGDRIEMMIVDAGLRVVVSRPGDPAVAALSGLEHVAVGATIRGTDPADPLPAPDPDSLAYVIFTSGSTGRPKGVMIGHRALLNFVLAIGVSPSITSADRLLAVTTLSFDIAGLELLVPLSVGGRVVVAAPETVIDPEAIAERLERHAITIMQATPATYRMLVDWGWRGGPQLRLLCGGEALPAGLARELLPRCGELWNMYGPTETTIWSLATRIGAGDPITIGTPLANTDVHVAGPRQELVPPGATGELLIGGAGLAQGYLGRDDLTDERFVPDTVSGRAGARLYRTGDVVRRRPDGRIEFVGRMDNQVKVRGFRIELGEVETVLERHPDVARAVAIVRLDERSGANRLLAYVVPHPGVGVEALALRHHCASTLPEYMVPAVVTVLDRFPMTLNGKVDRGGLPAPVVSTRAGLAPRTALERQIVGIWQHVLGLDTVGVRDDVFDLGATSLTTARLFAQVGRELDVRLPIATAFQASTVEKLAVLVEQLRGGAGAPTGPDSLVGIRTEHDGHPLFLVHGGAGTVLLYEPLARALADERPVYAFQAAGLFGDRGPHLSVAAMARSYLREMRAVQPHGPYYLGGYCYGALVAFEMARRLDAAGERTDLLVSFNGPSPSYIRRFRPRFDRDGAVIDTRRTPGDRRSEQRELLHELVTAPRSAVPTARLLAGRARWRAGRRWRHRRRDISLTLAAVRNRPLPDSLREAAGFQRLSELAQERYRPRRRSGSMLVVTADGLYHAPDLGWGDHLDGPVDHVVVPGAQQTPRQTMTDEFVGPVVDALRARMAELEDGSE